MLARISPRSEYSLPCNLLRPLLVTARRRMDIESTQLHTYASPLQLKLKGDDEDRDQTVTRQRAEGVCTVSDCLDNQQGTRRVRVKG